MNPGQLTDEYILSEIKKLTYPYGLNRVIRFNLKREEKFQTQSVAEHVTNMIFLAYYFRDLEDPKHEMDFGKLIRMIMMHDMGEIETGDILTVSKNENHEEAEREAIHLVKKKSPKFVADEIESLYKEFEDPKTREGQYANAIDKFEGQFSWIEKEGVEMLMHIHKNVGLESRIVHPIHLNKIFTMLDKYNFPAIKRFLEVVQKEKDKYELF